MAAWTAARDEHIATGTDRGATVARQLCRLRAVAETSAGVQRGVVWHADLQPWPATRRAARMSAGPLSP